MSGRKEGGRGHKKPCASNDAQGLGEAKTKQRTRASRD